MAELLEIPADWPPEYVERLIQVRIDRELEASLLRDRGEYADARSRMPAAVRLREDRVASDG